MAALAAMQGRAGSSGRRTDPSRHFASTIPGGTILPPGIDRWARDCCHRRIVSGPDAAGDASVAVRVSSARREPDAEAGGGSGAAPKASVFAHAAGSRHGTFPALPEAGDARLPSAPCDPFSHRRSGIGSGDASRGVEGACVPVPGGSGGTGRGVSRQDRRTAFGMPVPAVAGFLACEPASPAGANGCNATGRLPASPSRQSRKRPCRYAGGRKMTVPDGRCRGRRAAERSPGPESVTRDRTFVENQPLARPSGERGSGPYDAGLLAIANAIGSKVVNAAPAAATRRTRQGARTPAPGARQPVELTHVFRDRTDPRRPFGQDDGPAARGGFCSR